MANILKQIKIGNTTYDIEPVTAYLPLSDLGNTTFKVTRGASQSTKNTGYWAGMLNSNNTNSTAMGYPTLPSSGKWWHVISMDWTGTDTNNWISQLALPTQDGGVPHYRRNDNGGGVSIDSSTWHAFITDENIGSQSVNYANSAGSVAWDNISSKPITITQRNNDSPVSGAYAYGTYVTMRNTNNWFEIYAPHMGTSSSRVYMQTGWDNDRQGWKAIAWTSDIPTSLPASDVYAWAKEPTKPTYTKSEVGLGNVDNTADANKSVNYATSSHLLRTYSAGDGSHGADYYLKCRYNLDGDSRFKLHIIRSNGAIENPTSVDYANTAGSANYFNYGRGAILANSSSFTNNFCKDIFGEENNNNYHLVALRTNSQAPSCLLGDYSSGIAWKGSDTYGSLMVRYNTSEIRVSGGNGANTNPNWTVDLVHSGNIGSQNVNYANSAGSVAWDNITDKPSTFPPYGHGHSTATQSGDGFMSAADKKKLDGIEEGANKTVVDSSLSSTSWNPVRNSTIYSAFSGTVGFDQEYYFYGAIGSWRLQQYHAKGNSLDIRYGKVAIDAQEKTYSVSFKKPFNNDDYAIVCGVYRGNRNSCFWSPLVTSRTPKGFNVYVRGNTSGDNSGTLLYIAIRSN